jgi:hypothetical protein
VTLPARAKIVDQIGALEAALAPFAGDVEKLSQLRTMARTWPELDKAPAVAPVAYAGKRYVLTLGPRENQRKIRNLADVFQVAGRIRFVEACSLTLTALAELVGEASVSLYVEESRSGWRPITIAKL